jgi:hypothetical protein
LHFIFEPGGGAISHPFSKRKKYHQKEKKKRKKKKKKKEIERQVSLNVMKPSSFTEFGDS